MILGFFVVDERGIVAAAELRLHLGRDGGRPAVAGGRSDRARPGAPPDGRVGPAAVQPAAFASGRVSGKCSGREDCLAKLLRSKFTTRAA